MSYCITVYGDAFKQYTEKLFTIQKHCLRILFGDREAYLNKFKTCARARPLDKQKLGPDFYSREHCKPLFHKTGFLCFNNLYSYHLCLETLKILQSRLQSCLYESFVVSKRNSENLLLQNKNEKYTYFQNCTKLWNQCIKLLVKNEPIPSIKLPKFKRDLKIILLKIQNAFDDVNWYPDNKTFDTASKVS